VQVQDIQSADVPRTTAAVCHLIPAGLPLVGLSVLGYTTKRTVFPDLCLSKFVVSLLWIADVTEAKSQEHLGEDGLIVGKMAQVMANQGVTT
jgi:hypothetical protein